MALPENKAEEDEEEQKKQQRHKPNVSHLLQEEAMNTFLKHIEKYDQIEWLKPKHYTPKQTNLSLLCLVAAGAEESAVLHQMNGTAEDLITFYLAFEFWNKKTESSKRDIVVLTLPSTASSFRKKKKKNDGDGNIDEVDEDKNNNDDDEVDDNHNRNHNRNRNRNHNQNNNNNDAEDLNGLFVGTSQAEWKKAVTRTTFTIIDINDSNTEVNEDLYQKWKYDLNMQRIGIYSQSDSISNKILKELKQQMEQDKILMSENKFKTDNTHPECDKNMDALTYWSIYTKFMCEKFHAIWKTKGAHRARWGGPSAEFYSLKMRRLVMMRCYNFLQIQKENHLSN